jgi:hypothetical protein
LNEALRQITLRADKMLDPELRAGYLEGRHENRRARKLAGSLGVSAAVFENALVHH